MFPLTCDKYIPTRVKSIMATWGSFFPDRVIFLGDKEVLDRDTGVMRMMDCMHPKDNHPALTDNPYEDAPHKLFNALRELANSNFDWLFFCDDDTYVKVHLLDDYISELELRGDTTNVYSLDMIGCYEADRALSYPSGGAGWLIKRETLGKVVPYLDSAPCSVPDRWGDVMVGYALKSAGVKVVDDRVFFEMTEEQEWKEWQWTRGKTAKQPAITYHYMDPDRMLGFHAFLYNEIPVYYKEEFFGRR